MDFLDELESRIIPGDGPIGTLLMERSFPLERCFEELCVSMPDEIQKIHEEYIAAGARVIETNSFGANAVRLEKHGFANRVHEINWSAAQLAKQTASKAKGVYVAGSVGPLGISAEEAQARGIDREAAFRDQIGALLDGGAQIIFLETFLDLEELRLALYVKQSLHHCPVICSLVCREEGRLSSGMTVVEAFGKLREDGADVVGVNCINGPQAMVRLFKHIPAEGLISAYPNAGSPKYHEGRYLYYTTPGYFADAAVELANEGAKLIGGCCGLGPQHIAAMVAALKDAHPVTRKTVQIIEPLAKLKPSPNEPEPSILDALANGETVIVTELDTPKTLDLEKYFIAAKALTDAGSNVITLADNSLAILRMSNLAVGAMLKERMNITPLLHVSCRDRNLLGLQSELMGMSALGIRHILPLTGDPAKVGDHPGAASVYDVSSIELIKLTQRMNEGYNYIGKTLKYPANFVIGCTFNPNAKNLDAQVSRLERKVAAGAQYVMTQPIFDTRLVEEMARRTKHLNVPIFTGVWPLLNGRQAEFLHNEVPGIVIPENVRSLMAGLEKEEGRKRGLEIAKEVARAVLDLFPGIYLITPFLNYEMTAELAHFVRSNVRR